MENVENLDVDYLELEEALGEMKSAVEEFRDAGEGAFQADCDCMAVMNSDFVEAFSRILECFSDWNVKDLLHSLDTFCKDAGTIMEDLKAMDQTYNQSRLEGMNGRA